MLAACFLGVNGELWLGHDSLRTLTRGDGYLEIAHLAEFQHVGMYCAFSLAATVSLLTHRFPSAMPAGAPHAALAGAFTLEAALFAFHLEGTAFDVRAHTLLVLTIVACALATSAEAAWPARPELGFARAHAVLLQGIWFCALARVLFEGRRAWDPRYHGGYMFLVRGARRRAEERWGEPRLAGACTLPTLLSPSLSLPCSHFGRSASAPCASDSGKIALRYCVPMSPPCRFSCVGSCVPRNTS